MFFCGSCSLEYRGNAMEVSMGSSRQSQNIMRIISVLDTTVTSYNLGNEIIMEAIFEIMEDLFPDDFMYRLPWEGRFSKAVQRYMNASDFVFFGGTNSLSSNMLSYKQIGFRVRDLLKFDRLTLLGMGWWQYQDDPDLYSRMFIRRLLSSRTIHSVRDQYTKEKLSRIGITNVVNTCCPTTWRLTADHCSKIPLSRSDCVMVTLTDYNRSRDVDLALLKILNEFYKEIYYWIQGAGDLEYIKSFAEYRDRIKIVPPKLKKYDGILKSNDCDYIGTRLHAGIRAIQHHKRALILSVDNRASEISNDVRLNVVSRFDLDGIRNFICQETETKLIIPFDEIFRWKAQFQ